MAEKPDEMSLLDYKQVTEGDWKMEDYDLEMMGKVTWKLFVFSVGNKILRKEKEKIRGKESMIQFFPLEREEIVKKKGKSKLVKDLSRPLFYITYDKRQCPELIEKSGEKIPKELFYVILCR